MAVDASDQHAGPGRIGSPGKGLRRERNFAHAVAFGLTARAVALARAAKVAPDALLPRAGSAIVAVILILVVAFTVDRPIAKAAQTLPRAVVSFFADITVLGEGWVIVIPSALAALVLARLSFGALSRRTSEHLQLTADRALYVTIAVLLPSLVTTIVKHLVGRVRPPHIGIPDPFLFEPFSLAASRASFPSGHATVMGALLVAIGAAAPRWRGPALALAILVVLSRIAIDAHYTSDVVAGALLGTFGAGAVLALFAKARIGFMFDSNGATRRRGEAGSVTNAGVRTHRAATDIHPIVVFADEKKPAVAALQPRLSVVVPMRNEADNAEPLLDEIEQACAPFAPFEVVCIDDGSTDATGARLAELGMARSHLRVLVHAQSCGQSAAVHSGVRAARAQIVVTLDGDGQNDPAFIPQLLRALDTGGPATGLVAGQRLGRKDSGFKMLQSQIANAVRGRALRDGTRDTGCGLKAFRRDVFLALPYFDALHRFLPALVRREGYLVALVDVVDRPRRTGRSNYGLFDRLWVGILDLAGVWWLIRRRRRIPVASELRKDR
jgi:membrane-associated phospholipid phosphatase